MMTRSHKYSSTRDSALHYLCNADWGTESDGNSPEYGAYFTRISFTREEAHPRNTELMSVLDDWGTDVEGGDDGATDVVLELVGHFLVVEDMQGFVHVTEFPTEAALIRRYAQYCEHFYNWTGDDL